jgi:hypothetical protein
MRGDTAVLGAMVGFSEDLTDEETIGPDEEYSKGKG